MSWPDSSFPGPGQSGGSPDGWPSSSASPSPTTSGGWPSSGGASSTGGSWPSVGEASNAPTLPRNSVLLPETLDLGDTPLSDGASSGEIPSTARTSPLWLIVGLLLVVAAIGIFVAKRTATFGVIGWTLAGPLAIGAVAMFLVADSKARQNPWFVGSDALDWLRRAVIALALLGVALNAYSIAHDVARGMWT